MYLLIKKSYHSTLVLLVTRLLGSLLLVQAVSVCFLNWLGWRLKLCATIGSPGF